VQCDAIAILVNKLCYILTLWGGKYAWVDEYTALGAVCAAEGGWTLWKIHRPKKEFEKKWAVHADFGSGLSCWSSPLYPQPHLIILCLLLPGDKLKAA
jgi:hypothetical protein